MFRLVTADEQGYQVISRLQLEEILSGTFNKVRKTHIPVDKLMPLVMDGKIDTDKLHKIYEAGYILTGTLDEMSALERRAKENTQQSTHQRRFW